MKVFLFLAMAAVEAGRYRRDWMDELDDILLDDLVDDYVEGRFKSKMKDDDAPPVPSNRQNPPKPDGYYYGINIWIVGTAI